MDASSTTSLKPPVNSATAHSSVPDTKLPAPSARPSYSSKLGDTKAKASLESNTSTRQSQPFVPQQRAWAPLTKNPITGRTHPQFNNIGSTANKQSVTTFFHKVREGQRVYITVDGGAEFEGIYANKQSDNTSCYLEMVQQKKLGSGDTVNGSSKQQQPGMSFQRNKITDARIMGGNQNKTSGTAQNGSRTGFRTDTGISGGRAGQERTLKKWQPEASDPQDTDGGLEQSTKDGKPWDQFAENNRLFGVQTTYDEREYTTAIDREHPQYKERLAAADRKAREIERSAPTTSHVAEERVMDHAGGDDNGDEEAKYSGVQRQSDFPALTSSRESNNKYTPPARRAPAAHSTVKGAPVDPAIITAQLKAIPNKQPTPKPEDNKSSVPAPSKAPSDAKAGNSTADTKIEVKANDVKSGESSKVAEAKAVESKSNDKSGANLRASGPAGRNISPAGKENNPAPNATSTVERDVLSAFQNFASQQRLVAEKARTTKAKADKEVKLSELKKFAEGFKLATPVPKDLIGIIAKDPSRQKEIQDKARLNAEEMQKKKEAAAREKELAATKESQAKPASERTTAATGAGPATISDNRSNSRAPSAPQHTNGPANGPSRHPGNRQSYAPQSHPQQYRNDRSSAQNAPRHNNQQTGNLGQRLRNVEQHRMSQPPQHHMSEMRMPPTGPANAVDPSFNRRPGGLPPNNHMGPRLNPNSHEFRPSAYAQAFNPTGPSAASSPHSVAVNAAEVQPSPTPIVAPLFRRKLKKIDLQKCLTLASVESYVAPPNSNTKAWEDNGNLRPSYDTHPKWKEIRDDDKQESSGYSTYKEYFEGQPFAASSMATPNPTHVVPMLAHQYQLPLHLQHGAHGPGARQSPHMPPMQMQGGQPGHAPHVPFNNGDDGNRMMHSNSAQSYVSPRPSQVPMSYPSPAQMPYNQHTMPQFMGPSGQQMPPPFRYPHNPQFMPQQPGQMGTPLMGPQYMPGPSPMMGPQMQMYPGPHLQYVPPGQVPPQVMPGPNGFPSPGGRPAAPMMSHQGSHQGSQQGQYGMSPGMPYQQPVFIPHQPGQMANMRGYGNPGPQQFGTSPQQAHQYNNHNHNRNGNYGGGKNFQHSQHHGPHAAPTVPQGRTSDGQEEAK